MVNSQAKQKPYLSRRIRDKMFKCLFDDPHYVMQFYQEVHPEDDTATEADIEIVTIERYLTEGIYNDLGFMVGDKLLVLVEAQSTWSVNIVSRMLLYLIETYRQYLFERDLSLFDSKVVSLPTPELYVIYTGEGDVPDEVVFTRDILGGTTSSCLEVKARVIRDRKASITGQYVRFCDKYDWLLATYGRNFSADEATRFIQECIADDILPELLTAHLHEVIKTMLSVFDEETEEALYRKREAARRLEEDRLLKEAAIAEGLAEGLAEGMEKGLVEGRAEGLAEGLAEGEAKGRAETILQLASITGASAEELLAKMTLPPEEHAAVLEAMKALQSD